MSHTFEDESAFLIVDLDDISNCKYDFNFRCTDTRFTYYTNYGKRFLKVKVSSENEIKNIIAEKITTFYDKSKILQHLKFRKIEKFFLTKEITTKISKECNFEKIFKEIKPSSILIKGRQVKCKDQYIATLATSRPNIPTAIPSTMKIILCPFCKGRGFKSCYKCDEHINYFCYQCRGCVKKSPDQIKHCKDDNCSIKTGICEPGESHGHCSRCYGKGKMYQYVQIQTKESRKESISYRLHEGLQYEVTFPKLHKNLVDNFQGKIVYDIPAYKNHKHFIDSNTVERFKEDKRSFKEFSIELVPVFQVIISWKNNFVVFYVIGFNNYIYVDKFPLN